MTNIQCKNNYFVFIFLLDSFFITVLLFSLKIKSPWEQKCKFPNTTVATIIIIVVRTMYSALFSKGTPQMVYHTDPVCGGLPLGRHFQSKYPSSKSVGHRYFLFRSV